MDREDILYFINPATGEEFGQIAMTTPAEVSQASEAMRAAARIWSWKPPVERARILRQFQRVVIDAADEITAVMNQDTGKTRQDALIEIFMTVDVLHQYIKYAPRWLRRRRAPSGLYIFKRCYVEPKPYGVVAVIAPWNYPFALALPAVLGALLAGNTVLFKPSEVTSATGVLIQNLFERVPELAPFVRVLHGDARVGAALVQSKPDYIFLTGSTVTGKKVGQAAAEHLIPLACELGGKDAMLVLEDADIEQAAHWGVWGALFNSGQTCMGIERIYVVEQVYDQFVERAVHYARELKMGYSTEKNCSYYLGPLADPRQLRIIRRHLDDAIARGACILTGGKIQAMYVEPTVLVDVDHEMLLMQEETFGPLIPIMKVKDEVEAIRLANDSIYGLGASIWSNDIERAERIGHQIEASTIIVNDTLAQFAVPLLPFGGIKQSGYGRTHGKEGLIQFTRPYAYTIGRPPNTWDIATIVRKPGNYHSLKTLLGLAFGVTPRQRVRPLAESLEEISTPALSPAVSRAAVSGLPAALAALGALAGIVLVTRYRK